MQSYTLIQNNSETNHSSYPDLHSLAAESPWDNRASSPAVAEAASLAVGVATEAVAVASVAASAVVVAVTEVAVASEAAVVASAEVETVVDAAASQAEAVVLSERYN